MKIMIRDLGFEELRKKPPHEVLKALETSLQGLSEEEVKNRLKIFGLNEFGAKRRVRPFLLLASKFKNPMLIMLVVAALISGFLGSVLNSLIILAMVLASAVIDFVNTYRSEKTVEELEQRVSITVTVRRDSALKEESIQNVVPGDVCVLAAGDLVPADSVLIQGKDFFVNESVLTGESVPVEKIAEPGELREIWMGTSVVSGEGVAVAVKTGLNTKFGDIAKQLKRAEPLTEFERNLKDFSIFIFRITIFLVLAIVLLNIFFEKKKPLEIFLFAVAIAVGLTPELLPVIVTANLAKGARKMSRGGVIVRKLSAIYNFGSIDVLCTDKTGTLTEDKIALVKYLDGFGRETEQVLFYGYVNSVYATGVRGSLNRAVRDFKKMDLDGWEKVDEIPFDAERKRDSVVVKHANTHIVVTKGAPEEILKISPVYGEKNEPLTPPVTKEFEKVYERLSADGFRVLGVATKKTSIRTAPYTAEDEEHMTFLGFLAFLDPPKKTVKATLEKMRIHNVAIKIITGDNRLVTQKVASEISFPVESVMSGEEVEHAADEELKLKVEAANLFIRVNPEEKERIIKALRNNGHVVGYLGDGVNDVLSLRAADVGISVNNAVDIARDTADIILLKKGLGEIIDGIVQGRRTFANTFKYLMMALSSNFGNMFSMPVASLALPFLPMTPSQILLNNFLYDTSQLAIPFDRVDDEFLRRAKKFDLSFMKKFMFIFGPLSSLFDFATFFVMLRVFGLSGTGFQTGWFLESVATQTLVVNIIRTRQWFLRSSPSPWIILSSFGVVVLAWILPSSPLASLFNFDKLRPAVLIALAVIIALYLLSVEVLKKFFYKKFTYLIEK